MKRFLACLSVVAIVGCAAPVKPIVINRDEVIQSGTLAMRSIESGMADYLSHRHVDPNTLETLQKADMVARVALGDLTRSEAEAFPAQVQKAAVSLRALVEILPPGVIPLPIEAGLIAFTELAQIIAQTAPQPVPQPSTVVDSTGERPTLPTPPGALPEPQPPTSQAPAMPHYQVHPGAPPSIIE